jgi:hypothetical protein
VTSIIVRIAASELQLQSQLIETELAYIASLFRLRIRDHGKAIDPDERVRAERSGHWGGKACESVPSILVENWKRGVTRDQGLRLRLG